MDVKIYSIKELSVYVKGKFDTDPTLKNILIKGELSNTKHHSTGHIFFTLKEDDVAMDGVMFSSRAKSLGFQPKDGMKVIVSGYITTYPARGNYQVYAQFMKPDGAGDIYARYEELKKLLLEKGYFNPEHKKPIPKFPSCVGVLTASDGAAVKDVINTIGRRYPLTKILIYPTTVQGPTAKDSITANIKQANLDQVCDVLIVGRGGGSIEDLWAFNEEIVAQAIFHSTIPIISAVGHETDTTIADFVADVRAATPTAAAELAVPDRFELMRQLKNVNKHMEQSVNQMIVKKAHQVASVVHSTVFEYPERILDRRFLAVSNLMSKLQSGSPKEKLNIQETKFKHLLELLGEFPKRYYHQLEQNLSYKSKELYSKNPIDQVFMLEQSINHLDSSLENRLKQNIKDLEGKFLHSMQSLELNSPLTIMRKGYSIVKHNSKIVRSIHEVSKDDTIKIQVSDGMIETVVTSLKEE